MDTLPDDLNYRELKAELRILQGKIEDLNARLNGITPVVPSVRGRRLAKIAAFRWPLAAGFLALAGAVAQTSDPITIGPDGIVHMGKSLDVAGEVKAKSLNVAEAVNGKSFAGDASGLTVNGNSVAQAVAGKFKGDVEAAGKVKATLAIEAGNSDIYFTKTDHQYSLSGNAIGNAAIENSSNYNGLMILGRSTTAGRFVRMWDRVGIGGNDKTTVGAPLDVKGEIRGLPWRSDDFAWTQGQARKQMTKTDHSVCFLTGIVTGGGVFPGVGGGQVEIVADKGYWYLQGNSQIRNAGATARCIGAPDNSW